MKKVKKPKDYSAIEKDDEQFKKFRHNFVLQTLRKATYRWPFHHLKMKEQRRDRGLYECEACKKVFGPKEINKDHILPVMPVDTGFKNWDETIERMFVKSGQIQILCLADHDTKTLIENELRKQHGQKPIRTKRRK